jgi:hypothetical protein
MEAVYSSKTWVDLYHATWCYIPEDSDLQELLCLGIYIMMWKYVQVEMGKLLILEVLN